MGGARENSACHGPGNLWCEIVGLLATAGRHEFFPAMVQSDHRNLS